MDPTECILEQLYVRYGGENPQAGNDLCEDSSTVCEQVLPHIFVLRQQYQNHERLKRECAAVKNHLKTCKKIIRAEELECKQAERRLFAAMMKGRRQTRNEAADVNDNRENREVGGAGNPDADNDNREHLQAGGAGNPSANDMRLLAQYWRLRLKIENYKCQQAETECLLKLCVETLASSERKCQAAETIYHQLQKLEGVQNNGSHSISESPPSRNWTRLMLANFGKLLKRG